MKVLLGDTRSPEFMRKMQELGWGRMCCESAPKPWPYELWGFDNLAYAAWAQAGFPSGLTIDDWLILWDSDDYERRLRIAQEIPLDPYLAAVPDIPAGGLQSLEFSLRWREQLDSSWPWYLVVQDGMTAADVKPVAKWFSGLFLGGSDAFKNTARLWCDLAHG
jgi:hypothetical protein